MHKITTSLLACGMLVAPLHSAMADPKPYVGVELGRQSGVKFQQDPNAPLAKSHHSGLLGRVHAGVAWQVEKPLIYGVEMGISGYQPLKSSRNLQDNILNTKITRRSVDILGTLGFELGNNLHFFGKAGGVYLQQVNNIDTKNPELVEAQSYQVGKKKGSRIMPKGVIGIGYTVAPNQTVELSYSRTLGKGSSQVASLVGEQKLKPVKAQSINVGYNFYFS
jgi:hypothetical protein